MIKVETRKTYTMKCELTEKDNKTGCIFDLVYDHLRANEKECSFHNVNEICEWIEENLKPLVPFKKIKGFSFRDVKVNEQKLILTVTFNLNDVDYEFI